MPRCSESIAALAAALAKAQAELANPESRSSPPSRAAGLRTANAASATPCSRAASTSSAKRLASTKIRLI